MKYEIPYSAFAEKRINELCLENRNILSHKIENDDDDNMIITLVFQSFSVTLKYSEAVFEDYSFLENENNGKALIAKFEFPFSKIKYSIYDIHNTVEDNIFCTYAFHCLYNEAALGSAIETIFDFINRNYDIINSINSSEKLQEKLDASFENGLKVASKKITKEKLKKNPEKYFKSHDTDLYLLRLDETAFIDNIIKGSTKSLQNFHRHNLKKGTFLTFEERYMNYLIQNDLKHPDEEIVKNIKEHNKVSKKIGNSHTISIAISFILAMAINILIGIAVEKKIEKDYFLLSEVTIDNIFKIIPMIFGFILLTLHPIENLLMRKNKNYDTQKTKNDKKAAAILALIGIICIAGSSAYFYFDFQKNVGLGKNDIYYCQKLAKVEKYAYNEAKLYLIEGTYYDNDYSDTDDDKKIVVIINNDYKDYYVSEYLTVINMTNDYRDSLKYAGKFKSIEDFDDTFNNH